jgi:fumarate hydratase subunit alpha
VNRPWRASLFGNDERGGNDLVTSQVISEATEQLLAKAAIRLPQSVKQALQEAFASEEAEVSRHQLQTILENISIAESRAVPVCQDTGVPIFFVRIGRGFPLGMDLSAAIAEGTANATKLIPLRENVIHPLTKENSGTNTGWKMPFIYYDVIDGDFIEITALLKGYGSEAKTSLAYIATSEDLKKGITKFVMDCVKKAMGEPCPPYILGVGLGGSSDIASVLSKKAFMRLPLRKPNPDPKAADLEESLLKAVNATGIGPMGLGGKTTALAVHVEICGTHTGAVPVVAAFQCWADRQATVRVDPDGKYELLEESRYG